MKIPFWKMHGAGNDFILVDDRKETFPVDNQEWIESCASRRTGVGSDGVILIQPSGSADFKMRFFNPDGREAEMCGNGARCVARLAKDLGVAGSEMSFETVAGPIRAESAGDIVTLRMTEPFDWALDESLEVDGISRALSSVNTGVPHAVMFVDDVAEVDLPSLGPAVRYHDRFAPGGINLNVVSVTGENTLRIRTYERGVECETLACGTGMVAACLVAAKLGKVTPVVSITCASNTILSVDFSLTDDGASGVTLRGPATHVYQGELPYSD